MELLAKASAWRGSALVKIISMRLTTFTEKSTERSLVAYNSKDNIGFCVKN